MSSFPLPVRIIEGCAVVDLPCEVDFCNADTVSRTLLTVLNRGVTGLVADMTATRFSDVAGIRAVVRAHNRAQELGCWVRVVISRPCVRKAFALTGAEAVVPIYGRLSDALPGAREDVAEQADLSVPIALLIPPQPRYPELLPLWEAGESAALPSGAPSRWAAVSVPRQCAESPEATVAPTGLSGDQPGPVRDLAPEERTPELITRVRAARDYMRAARSRMSVVCARLAVTCANIAAAHERLAQRRPDEAALLLSISEAARDRARAYSQLAANMPRSAR